MFFSSLNSKWAAHLEFLGRWEEQRLYSPFTNLEKRRTPARPLGGRENAGFQEPNDSPWQSTLIRGLRYTKFRGECFAQ